MFACKLSRGMGLNLWVNPKFTARNPGATWPPFNVCQLKMFMSTTRKADIVAKSKRLDVAKYHRAQAAKKSKSKKESKRLIFNSKADYFPVDRTYELTPKILNTNVRGLRKKLPELEALLQEHEIDFACLTETFCHKGIPDVDLHLNGYQLHRRDRPLDTGVGGGVICYVSDRLDSEQWPDMHTDQVESVWLTVKKPDVDDEVFIFASIYHPPQARGQQLAGHISLCLDAVLQTYPRASIVLTGDFNRFQPRKLCFQYDLDQIVDRPTYKHRLLDKVITNRRDLYNQPVALPEIRGSDHKVVICTPKDQQPPSE